jgi:hypothetical protein
VNVTDNLKWLYHCNEDGNIMIDRNVRTVKNITTAYQHHDTNDTFKQFMGDEFYLIFDKQLILLLLRLVLRSIPLHRHLHPVLLPLVLQAEGGRERERIVCVTSCVSVAVCISV